MSTLLIHFFEAAYLGDALSVDLLLGYSANQYLDLAKTKASFNH